MQIESTIRRAKGTTVKLGANTYKFGPAPDGTPHVAEVANTTHAAHLLELKPTVFVQYKAEDQAPVPQAAAVTTISGDLKGTAHPALVTINPGEEKVSLEQVVSDAAKYADLSPSDWNSLSDTARFEFVEQYIVDRRREHRSAQLTNSELPVDTNAERLANGMRADPALAAARSSASALAPEAVAAEHLERERAQDKLAESLRDGTDDDSLDAGTKPKTLSQMTKRQLENHAKLKGIENPEKMERGDLIAALKNFGLK